MRLQIYDLLFMSYSATVGASKYVQYMLIASLLQIN